MNSIHQSILQRSRQVIANLPSVQAVGRLTVVQGTITASLPASLGELVEIENSMLSLIHISEPTRPY